MESFCQARALFGEDRCQEFWEKLRQPQLTVPQHVIRVKSQLLLVLLVQLEALSEAVGTYKEKIKSFFASMPAAELVKTLPGAKTGTIVATLCGDR